MHPHPLFGISPHLAFDDCSRRGGELQDPVLERTVSRDRQGRMDFGFMGAVSPSVDESRDDRTPSPNRKHGATRGRPGGSAEKWNKDARDVTNVLIDEERGNSVRGQGTNHLLSGSRASEDDLGPEAAPQSGYEAVDPGIVEPSRGGCQWDARNWQPGAENLPGAAMAGGENDPTPSLEGLEEILHAIQLAQILDILRLCMPQPGDLGEHQPEMFGTTPLNRVLLALVEFREGDLEVGANPLSTSGQESNGSSAEG